MLYLYVTVKGLTVPSLMLPSKSLSVSNFRFSQHVWGEDASSLYHNCW